MLPFYSRCLLNVIVLCDVYPALFTDWCRDHPHSHGKYNASPIGRTISLWVGTHTMIHIRHRIRLNFHGVKLLQFASFRVFTFAVAESQAGEI